MGWPWPEANTFSPQWGRGERIERAKVRKLMGQNTLLICGKKKKKSEISKWYKGKCSLPPTSRTMASQSPSNGYLPRNILPSVAVAEHEVTWNGMIYPLVSSAQVSQMCPLSASCPYPTFSLRDMLCKLCSAIAKTLVYYQCCFSDESKNQHHRGFYEEI